MTNVIDILYAQLTYYSIILSLKIWSSWYGIH